MVNFYIPYHTTPYTHNTAYLYSFTVPGFKHEQSQFRYIHSLSGEKESINGEIKHMSHTNQTKYKDNEKLWLPLMVSRAFVLCIGYG